MSQASDPGGSSSKDADVSHDKKRRRVQQACDMCRHKRVRCEKDDASKPCTSCLTNHYTCTYTQSNNKQPASRAYIENLENRLKNMEALIEKLSTQQPNMESEAGFSTSESSPFVREDEPRRRDPSFADSSVVSPETAFQDSSDEGDSSEDEYFSQAIRDTFRDDAVPHPGNSHFFGKSSSVALVRKTQEAYKGYARAVPEPPSSLTPLPRKRTEFWQAEPWLKVMTQKPHFKYSFPPDDLLTSLIDLDFLIHNTYSPLLHRPTFQRGIKDGLHLRDDGFACIVLLVCSIAARSSNDPRVLLDGCDSVHSAGWRWFNQVQRSFQIISYETPRLYDLQTIILMIHFLNGSAVPQNSWPLIGIGLRLAQARGAHRRKAYPPSPTVEAEQVKRAFWHLVLIDRGLSSAFGLPPGIQDEEIDVDFPLEVDDEYWITSDPSEAFKQPSGKPSRVAHFNCCIRLSLIHGQVLRTIYSINKSKLKLGRGKPEWEEQMITELDSALNGFMDSIPQHLRWNPHEEDIVFLGQSAGLYASFYSLQITVHRSFIPPPGKHSRVQIPSLTICTNAARSCLNVCYTAFERFKEEDQRSHPDHPPLHLVDFVSVFTSAMILLLNIWSSRQPRNSPNVEKDMGEVQKALQMIQTCERRCFLAGRIWDILYGMSTIGERTLSTSLDPASPSLANDPDDENNQALQVASEPAPFGFSSTDLPFDYDFFSSFAFPDSMAGSSDPGSAQGSTANASLFTNPSVFGPYYIPQYDYGTSAAPALPHSHHPSAPPSVEDVNSHMSQDGSHRPVPSSSSQDPHALDAWPPNPANFHWEDWSK